MNIGDIPWYGWIVLIVTIIALVNREQPNATEQHIARMQWGCLIGLLAAIPLMILQLFTRDKEDQEK